MFRPFSPTRTGLIALASTLSCTASSGCKEDEGPGKLFEEEGVWSLARYDLEGTGALQDINKTSRGDAFMLKFEPEKGVVSTASCGEDEDKTPATSQCRLDPNSSWFCRCFGYAFEESEMKWVEFEAGSLPPEVMFDDMMMMPAGTGTGGDTGAAMPGEPTIITVAELPDQASTIDFRPMPFGVFGSNGTSSRYVFQQKTPSVFDEVTCDPCAGG